MGYSLAITAYCQTCNRSHRAKDNEHRLLLNKARRTKNKPFWTFSISFEEAKQYRRNFLNALTRESQWEEIIVDIYL